MAKSNKMKISLTVASMGALLLAAACSSGGSNTGKEGNAAEEAKKPAGPFKIEVFHAPGTNKIPSADQDELKKALEKKLGIELNMNNYQGAGAEYANQLNVRMASADFPDMFSVPNLSTLHQYAESGMLLDLTPYMDQLKDYVTFVGENTVKAGKVGSKQFAIVKNAYAPQESYWIRKDWLDKLGLKAPTTLDELYDVAKAFTEQDPDGNGKKDTLGISGVNMSTFDPIYGAFGITPPGTIMIRDGKMLNTFYAPEMKAALTYIKKLNDAKLVDSELSSMNNNTFQQKLFQGQPGIVFSGWPLVMKDEFISQWKAINPKAEWIQVGAPKGPGGQFMGGVDISKNSGIMALPASLQKQPEKLKKVLELINYVSTKEGSRIGMYGIEGRHYNLKNGVIEPTELMNTEGNYFYIYQFTGRPEMEYLQTKFPKQMPFIDVAVKAPRIQTYQGLVIHPPDMNTSDATRFSSEELLKFMYGKTPIDQYDAFLKQLETTYNYKAINDFTEKKLKENGILK